jgi:hypothetical protein
MRNWIMANTPTPSSAGSAFRASRRFRPSMSPKQLQAYLLARETLRRVKATTTPFVPPDPPPRASARPSS